METFSALLAICAGNSPVTGEIPTQRPVTQNFDIFFVLRLNNWFSKQWWAGDLRRHRTHYDVTVMVHAKHYAHKCALLYFVVVSYRSIYPYPISIRSFLWYRDADAIARITVE